MRFFCSGNQYKFRIMLRKKHLLATSLDAMKTECLAFQAAEEQKIYGTPACCPGKAYSCAQYGCMCVRALIIYASIDHRENINFSHLFCCRSFVITPWRREHQNCGLLVRSVERKLDFCPNITRTEF